MDVMAILEILIALLLVALTLSIWRSHRFLTTLINKEQVPKLDENLLREHVIYTRTTFSTIFTTAGLMAAVLVFLGVNAYSRIDELIQQGVKAKGDSITASVTRETTDKVKRLYAINLDSLIQKGDNITAIESDIQAQKKLFDRAYKNGMLRSDSLRTMIVNTILHDLGPVHDERADYLRKLLERIRVTEQRLNALEDTVKRRVTS